MADNNNDILKDILRQGIDRRFIYIDGEITADKATEVIGLLTQWEGSSDNTPIKIFINTFGGSLSCSFAIADVIENSKLPVFTIGIGQVFSGGFVILIAGTKRLAYPHTDIMFHNFSTGMETIKYKDFQIPIQAIWIFGYNV